MAALLRKLEDQALQLPPKERSELIHRLIISLDGAPEESPEVIAKAWDEEIARRVADMEAGRTKWIPAEEVFKEVDAIISAHNKRRSYLNRPPALNWLRPLVGMQSRPDGFMPQISGMKYIAV